jgi:hypothetical protein
MLGEDDSVSLLASVLIGIKSVTAVSAVTATAASGLLLVLIVCLYNVCGNGCEHSSSTYMCYHMSSYVFRSIMVEWAPMGHRIPF